MGKNKKVKIPMEVDYGKSAREILIEKGLLSTNEDPGKNIIMPKRKSKEEYEQNNPFKKNYQPMSSREEYEYDVKLAQKMLSQFFWRDWMHPFINEDGSPKIYTRIKSSGRKKITIKEVEAEIEAEVKPKKRQKIQL